MAGKLQFAAPLLILIAGCATSSTLQRFNASNAPLPIPFIAQKSNYCGPAALAMLANFYGHAVSQDEIATAIYLPEIRGALTSELADYARRFNLWVRFYHGTSDGLRQKIASGVPMLVLGKFGVNYHYFVVLGFDDFRHSVIVHSDTRARLEMPQEEFLLHWNATDRWTLLACPPDRAQWELSADEHNDLGVFLERDGQLIEAAAHYQEAAALNPSNSYFALNLGNALRKQGNVRDATTAFAKAVELDPQNADALNNLADAYLELGEHLDQAAELCQRAATLRPTHRAYYLDTLGSIRLKQGRNLDAVEAFESALAATTERQSSLRAGIEQRLAAARALVEK
jgi:tetratricopeptide (TPR) repeat protein